MTLTQLEYALAVKELGSFGIAAEHCHVSQPALSTQIQKLESELNIKLFDRSKQPIETTTLGIKVLEQAKIALQEVAKIKDCASSHLNQIAGTLTLGVIPTIAPYLLPLFLQDFIEKYPLLHLRVVENTTESLLKKLKNNEVEIAILATPIAETSLETVPLYYEEFALFCSEDNKLLQQREVLAKDIDLSKLWILQEGHCFRDQVLNFCERKEQLAIRDKIDYEAGSIETLKRMVNHSDGTTIMPALALQEMNEDETERIRYFEGESPVREISLVYASHFNKTQLIKMLKEGILRVIPAYMKEQKYKEVIRY
jgi:LysR family transcriptional regulator, hydrogen peroxide-inducible genes activator